MGCGGWLGRAQRSLRKDLIAPLSTVPSGPAHRTQEQATNGGRQEATGPWDAQAGTSFFHSSPKMVSRDRRGCPQGGEVMAKENPETVHQMEGHVGSLGEWLLRRDKPGSH